MKKYPVTHTTPGGGNLRRLVEIRYQFERAPINTRRLITNRRQRQMRATSTAALKFSQSSQITLAEQPVRR